MWQHAAGPNRPTHVTTDSEIRTGPIRTDSELPDENDHETTAVRKY